MKKTHVIAGFFTGIALFAIVSCQSGSGSATNGEVTNRNSVVSNDSLIKKGAYLVNIMDCNECHSPKIMTSAGPEPDPERLLSGHPANLPFPTVDTADLQSFVLFHPMSTAAAGPWGVSFAANLTSDESGIGNWSEEQFIRAIRQGKQKGLESGRTLLPPMPWRNYATHLKDEDLTAIFAYLKSTKPVQNVVPSPIDLQK
ncbi:MAG TPA: c-type cytochrome [Flavisolibacter sp.]